MIDLSLEDETNVFKFWGVVAIAVTHPLCPNVKKRRKVNDWLKQFYVFYIEFD